MAEVITIDSVLLSRLLVPPIQWSMMNQSFVCVIYLTISFMPTLSTAQYVNLNVIRISYEDGKVGKLIVIREYCFHTNEYSSYSFVYIQLNFFMCILYIYGFLTFALT